MHQNGSTRWVSARLDAQSPTVWRHDIRRRCCHRGHGTPVQRTPHAVLCHESSAPRTAPKCLPVESGRLLAGRLGVRWSVGRSRSACPRMVRVAL